MVGWNRVVFKGLGTSLPFTLFLLHCVTLLVMEEGLGLMVKSLLRSLLRDGRTFSFDCKV